MNIYELARLDYFCKVITSKKCVCVSVSIRRRRLRTDLPTTESLVRTVSGYRYGKNIHYFIRYLFGLDSIDLFDPIELTSNELTVLSLLAKGTASSFIDLSKPKTLTNLLAPGVLFFVLLPYVQQG